jgi:hypothetical protein
MVAQAAGGSTRDYRVSACPNGALPVVATRVERPMAIGGAGLQLKFTGSE